MTTADQAKDQAPVQPVFRFAPSPNGELHLGHAFSALTDFALCRAAGGCFLLRIEDIDRARCRPEFAAAILRRPAAKITTPMVPLTASMAITGRLLFVAQLTPVEINAPIVSWRKPIKAAALPVFL